jgi:predicted Co/Zn/Cd cation transporter (cation efflux family)
MEGSDFPRKAKLAISVLLIIAGFAMYWAWGLIYDSWNILEKEFIGVYSIVVVLIVFGVLGLLLSRKQKQ